jgi:hypothetical protein
MTQRLRQSESTAVLTRIPLFLVDDTDGKTPEPSVTLVTGDLKVSKNGGSFVNGAGTFTNSGAGLYYYNPTSTELDTLGPFLVKFEKAGVRLFVKECQITGEDPYVSPNVRGTVATNAGNTTSTFVTNLTNSTTDYYKAPQLIHFLSGALEGVTRQLAASGSYNGTTKFLTVASPLPSVPGSNIAFEIITR